MTFSFKESVKVLNILLIFLSSSFIMGCGNRNGNATSKIQSDTQDCASTPEFAKTCGKNWAEWVYSRLGTGYFGRVDPDGSRYSAAGEDRSAVFFIYGPYPSLTRPGKISGDIILEATAVINNHPTEARNPNTPFGPRRWIVTDRTAEIAASPAFTIDMVTKTGEIGRRIVTLGEFTMNGWNYTFNRQSIGFSSPFAEQYQEIQVRIRDVHPSVNIRAFQTSVRALLDDPQE